jgi:hypothetical protein
MDYSQLLTRAGKILWQHKSIPVFFTFFISIPSLTYLLFFGAFALFSGQFSSEQMRHWAENQPDIFNQPTLWIGWGLAALAFCIFSYTCLALGMAGACKGILLAENNTGEISFSTLWQASLGYVGQVLVVFAAIGAVFVTLALGLVLPVLFLSSKSPYSTFLFAIPLVCFFVPVSILGRVLVEMLIAAVADDLGIVAAVERIWKITKTFLGPLVLITLLLMAIEFAINMAVSIPLGIVQQVFMQFLAFGISSLNPDTGFGSILKTMYLFTLLTVPITAITQGFMASYNLAGATLAYLNLKTKIAPKETQPETFKTPDIR